MSIAIMVAVHDGLVLAADSASTLTVTSAPGAAAGVANVYDNANKIFNLYKGRPIGCITFGAGSIGNSSIGTLIKDIRSILMEPEKAKQLTPPFDPNNYTVEDVAKIVAKFLGDECQRQQPVVLVNLNIGFQFGGYSTKDGERSALGESWSVEIKAGVASPPIRLRAPDQPGVSWGGQTEVLQRIVIGYSPQVFQVLSEVMSATPGQNPVSGQQLFEQLNPLLLPRLQAPLVFAPMPIQDAIDLARFLVHAASMYSRFLPGPQVVGGPVEIAAITKHEGFKWISRKHYYERSLNQEPAHVVVD